ncbi:bifunctional lysozyme/C40 family peptidase [Bacillus subtilis]|uniref:bifunctional lytic transglycosylase/C40 family peptidase n=1 Tax=Bacillus TaxID=1386 RepID=UPI0008276481|nr:MULTISPECIES: bifunctional lytic transglycosylase/C40 family peptidase [Bacillus subtilis group]MCT6515653.1 bifunctional lysozyme/C40 family peptidase [Bacillus subtilis]OCB98118.1 Pneumococcal vaccine antigen A like protein [Bacillus amyloliquefaciens]QEO08523.1 transglycosylase SLT domain-containing protein [Bacillus paralicheniformis]HEO2443885.1 lysozyme family protein [Streptococcus agalactiae]
MQEALKKGVKVARTIALLKNPLTWIVAGILLLLSSIIGLALFLAVSLGGDSSFDSGGIGEDIQGTAQVSAEVLRYEPLIRKYAKENNIEEHVGVILALIQQESGGRHLDVMQSSESIGLPPGAITDPELSIQVGVKYFAKVLKQAKGDIKLALQSYNFGNGFIDYALSRGGYSKEVAVEFSRMMALKTGWGRYGDVDYVDHVMRYYKSDNDSIPVKGDGTQTFNVEKVHNIMKKYLGRPYVWGGRTPAAGGFDCSGLMEYAFAQVGINIRGTAQSQYDKTKPVPEDQIKPGDLVFFSTYKPGASHVGMYVGDGKFINANDNGIEYSSVETWKNLYPFLGFRRIQ